MFWLYATDFNAGLINLVLYFFYIRDLQLDDGSRRSEHELNLLVNFVAYSCDVHGIRTVDIHTPAVVDICRKVRKIIFLQLAQLSFWTMLFGALEMTLYLLGRTIIQDYSSQGKVIIC